MVDRSVTMIAPATYYLLKNPDNKPPVRVMEPVTRPMMGSRPSAPARPTPTTFCTTMKALTTLTWIFSGLMSMRPWGLFKSPHAALETESISSLSFPNLPVLRL